MSLSQTGRSKGGRYLLSKSPLSYVFGRYHQLCRSYEILRFQLVSVNSQKPLVRGDVGRGNPLHSGLFLGTTGGIPLLSTSCPLQKYRRATYIVG